MVETLKAKYEVISTQMDTTKKGKETLAKEILIKQRENSSNENQEKKKLIKLREQTRVLSKELEKVVAHRNTIHS